MSRVVSDSDSALVFLLRIQLQIDHESAGGAVSA